MSVLQYRDTCNAGSVCETGAQAKDQCFAAAYARMLRRERTRNACIALGLVAALILACVLPLSYLATSTVRSRAAAIVMEERLP